MAGCYNDNPRNREGQYYTGWNCGSCQACKGGYDVSWLDSTNDSSHGVRCLGDTPPFGYVNRCNTYCAPGPDTYPGSPDELAACCIGKIDEKKCRPGYCRGSAACRSHLRKFCATDFALTDDSICKAWCRANPGECDVSARDYCRRHPDDVDFCACLNSPAATGGAGSLALPTCFDGNCVVRGYQTATMVENAKHCPQVCQQAVNCYQQTGGQCNIDKNQFELHCGGTLPDIKPTPPQSNMIMVILFILLVLCGMILVSVALITSRRSSPIIESSAAKA